MANISNKTDQYNLFWENLIIDSQDLEEPVHYKKPFSHPVINLEDIKSVFIGINNDSNKNKTSLLRTYINGLRSDEHVQAVSKLPPTLSESLEEWAYRIFEKNRFCIIVNKAHRWSEALSIKIGDFVTPILKRFPIPQITVEVTIFVGNYIYTPFGVHLDEPHYRTLHLHLTGKKDFLLWDKEVFRSVTGSEDSYYKPGLISGHSNMFEVSEQDTFLLPAKYYHICQSKEFTVGAAITFSKNTKKRVFLEVFGNISKELSFHIQDRDVGNFFIPESIQYQDIASEIIPNVSIENLLEQSLTYYIFKKHSNLAFREPPLEYSMPFTHFIQLKRRKVKLCHPYKIFTYLDNERIHIFVRHNHLIMENFPVIQLLINFLNDGKVIKVSEILKEYSNFLAEDTLLGTLSLFIKFRGIEIMT